MSGNTLLIQPLADTSKRDTGSLPNNGIGVDETCIQEWPEALHVRANELGAALDGDTKRHHGGFPLGGIGRGHVLGDDGMERGEDERGREGGSERVDGAECDLQREGKSP